MAKLLFQFSLNRGGVEVVTIGGLMRIKDIAKRAGVSIGTVDRVLHKRGRVASKTEEKILKIVKDSGYSVNHFASNLANSKKIYKISIIMPRLDQDSGYWNLVYDGIVSLKNELKSYNIAVEVYYFDRFSDDDFRSVYEKQNKSDADALFIAPVLSRIAKQCFKDNPCKKVYAFFDSNLPDLNSSFFIGQDSFQGGVLGGKMLHLLIGDSGTVCVVRMLPDGDHINDRVAGFLHYFKDFPDIDIEQLDVDYSNNSNAIENACEYIINSDKKIKALFVTNASTHLFAKKLNYKSGALKTKDKIKLVGYDLVAENMECLNDQSIDFLISQNPQMQAVNGLRLLYRRLILKEECEKKIVVPLEIVTKENMGEIVNG